RCRSELCQSPDEHVLQARRVGRGEPVPGDQRLAGPALGLFGRADLPKLGQQPLAQGGGLLAFDDGGWLSLALHGTWTVAARAGRCGRAAVRCLSWAGLWCCRREWWRRASAIEVRRIQIVLAGDADQCEQPVAPGV